MVLIQVARDLRQDDPSLQVVVAHVDPRRTALIQEILDRHDADFIRFEHGPLQPWLGAARLVIAKSGTGSLEACEAAAQAFAAAVVDIGAQPTRFF